MSNERPPAELDIATKWWKRAVAQRERADKLFAQNGKLGATIREQKARIAQLTYDLREAQRGQRSPAQRKAASDRIKLLELRCAELDAHVRLAEVGGCDPRTCPSWSALETERAKTDHYAALAGERGAQLVRYEKALVDAGKAVADALEAQ